MKTTSPSGARRLSPFPRERGATLVEFAISVSMALLVMVACVEFDRVLLVYNSLTYAAQRGVRYATVHGSDRTTTAGDPPSGPSDTSHVTAVTKYFAKFGALDSSKLTIKVNYPNGNSNPGSTVTVSVSYPYDPMTYVPISLTLKGYSSGVIVF